MRSRPRGSASTRSRKLPDQRKPSLRSKKENPPGPVETPATGPAAGPLSYPDAKIVTANGASRPSAPAINPDERSGLVELCERQDITVGISEPCHLVAARCRPDAVLVLIHAVIPHEHNAPGGQTAHDSRDIGHPPAENGVAGPCDFSDRRYPQHGAVRVKHACEVVLLDHGQAQRPLVEHSCLAQVSRTGKGDDLA